MPRSLPDSAALLSLLEARAPRPLSVSDIARLLALEDYDRRAMQAVLESQVADRRLRRIGKTRYQWVPSAQNQRRPSARRDSSPRLEGRYARVRGGFGFVEVPGLARDILIPEGDEGGALHGDRVAVDVRRGDRRGGRTIGRIAAVITRAREHVVGTLERHGQRWLLVPEDELLPPVDLLGDEPPPPGDEGKVALARLTRAPSKTRNAGGVLERVLGDPDDPEVQFLVIAYEHGLRIEFPPDVLAEAETCRAGVRPTTLGGGTARDGPPTADLRDLPFVTVDGETARDFDDAVAVESLGHGRICLRVAIADVSHYVQPGSGLDGEAARRGTSVYFPDRAIPMLPEALSNDLCSLRPHEDRKVVVAEVVLDRNGHRVRTRFQPAVIRSHARLTYTRVAAVLSDADTAEIQAWRAELGPLVDELRRMHALMRVLHRERLALGSLDLDLPEALVDLSEEGRSIGVRLFQRNDAHRIIEELMLQANCAVAEFLRQAKVPFPYRIHEPPGPDSIDDLNEALGPFGIRVQWKGEVEPADVQRLLAKIEGHRLGRVLARLVLRSLAKARYSTNNAGHFGLAFPVYCHFTSPIRRYPDLLVHRQLLRVLGGEIAAARAESETMEQTCQHVSFLERQAMEAERAMLDLKKAEFMLEHLLEPMAATVVGVARFGAFAELDAYPIEGLVRADTENRAPAPRTRGRRGQTREGRGRPRRQLQLGDRVVVEATNASLRHRRVDLTLVERAVAGPPRAGLARRL